MSRYKERQNAVSIVYIHLLRDQDVLEIMHDNAFVVAVGAFLPDLKIGSEMSEVVIRAAKRKGIYESAMNHYLSEWRFDRLGYMEQAILLVACSELELGYQEKVIIMNEAVRLAKDFGDEASYKLINGVLDAL